MKFWTYLRWGLAVLFAVLLLVVLWASDRPSSGTAPADVRLAPTMVR